MANQNLRNQLIYDLPTRVFHWLFAVLFFTAFVIAKSVDDESSIFSYHMLAGLLLGFTVLLRIIWGFTGSKHARFSSFALRPKDLLDYFKGFMSAKWAGHNPASSWAALVMMFFTFGLVGTGYLMASGQKERFEDVHEVLSHGFLVVVFLHIAGVILHGFRHRDSLAFSMLDGAKSDVPASETISSSRPFVALLFVVLVLSFATFLMSRFDEQNRTLNLFGTQLELGENENHGGEHDESKSESGHE